MRYILAGTSVVMRTPRLWRFIVQPLLVGALAFVAMSVAAYWLIVPRLDAAIDARLHAGGPLAGVVALFSTALYVLLLFVASGFLYLTAVSFFSASMWEKLSLEVELMHTGHRIEAKLPIGAIVGDNLQRGVFALAVTLLSLCCGWAFFGLPAILLAGYLGLHDYTASAFLRRGITFSGQRRYVRSIRGRFGFLVGAGLLTLIPLLNVLMLPCLVAGGTLMVADSELDRGHPGR